MKEQPDIRPVKESGDIYVLMEDYPFTFQGSYFYVPKGFRNDGATCAKLLFQRDGVHRAAALVHDYLYSKQGLLNGLAYTRKQADCKFRDMLKEYGVQSMHVAAAYAAVYVFGRFTRNGLNWAK